MIHKYFFQYVHIYLLKEIQKVLNQIMYGMITKYITHTYIKKENVSAWCISPIWETHLTIMYIFMWLYAGSERQKCKTKSLEQSACNEVLKQV